MTQCNEGKKDTYILPNSFLGKLAYQQQQELKQNKAEQQFPSFKNNALFLLNILHMLFM